MTEEEQILTLLQHGDSFFPSGAVSFSWGLEMLKNDNVINSKSELEDYIENQLTERWGPFDRVILFRTYECADNIEKVIFIDNLIECMTLTTELREGSKRLGIALLTTYKKLNNEIAQRYLTIMNNQQAHGHLSVSQGLIWKSIGLSKNSVLMLSAYTLCISVLGAALRLGMVGHIDCQNSLTRVRRLITDISTWPIPEIEEIHSFTPFTDIASMRHENTDSRLFAN